MGKTAIAYEPPEIESVTAHFMPDNSGGICLVCARYTRATEYFCEECSQFDLTTFCDDDVQHKWYSKELMRFADAVGPESPRFCSRDVYPLRYPDGHGHVVCHRCLTQNRDFSSVAYCQTCGFYADRRLFVDNACRWCHEHGEAVSQLCAALPRLARSYHRFLVQFFDAQRHVWHTERRGIEFVLNNDDFLSASELKPFVYAIPGMDDTIFKFQIPHCLLLATAFHRRMGHRPVTRPNRYEILMARLVREPYLSMFAAAIETEYNQIHSDLEHLIQIRLQLYCSSVVLHQVIQLEWQRFQQFSDQYPVFAIFAISKPIQRLKHALNLGLAVSEQLSQLKDELPDRKSVV